MKESFNSYITEL